VGTEFFSQVARDMGSRSAATRRNPRNDGSGNPLNDSHFGNGKRFLENLWQAKQLQAHFS
jgi:hypothetical protein